jgi:hypothetical protein
MSECCAEVSYTKNKPSGNTPYLPYVTDWYSKFVSLEYIFLILYR